MRVLIADDEELARMRLKGLLEGMGGCEIVGEARNGREALLQCNSLNPDVLLLDIRMPGMDGLEAARHLASLDQPPAVIFTTAYGEHALEAFDAHALDYLLKPVRRERLAQALSRASKLTRAQVGVVKTAQDPVAARTHICARAHGNLQLIPIRDVLYFQADQKYVTVRHARGQVLIEDSLRALEQEFEGHFSRIHRNALVADACLLGMEKDADGGYRVRLRGTEDRLEVSRRHVAGLRKRLKKLGR